MFRSLRSRLLLSYTVVILAALAFIFVAALFIGSLPAVRYVPTLRELDAISQVSRSEILRLIQAGGNDEQVLQVLAQTAVDSDVRVIIATASTQEVIYDSSERNSWIGVTIAGVTLPERLLPAASESAIAGLFQAPDGSSWLVYSRPITGRTFGRLFILYARPEPTRMALFRELGLFNLLGGAGVITFLLAVLLAFGVAAWIARPLSGMAGAAEAIAQGDYDQQLPLQGPEEVRRVAGSFNSMAAQVAATRQAQRDFVANVSHDLKTPITSIRGWSQALLDGTAVSTDDQQQAAGIIHSEAERMERMVNQLLDLARIESGQIVLQKTAVDLGHLLAGVRHSLLVKAQEKGVELTTALAPAPPVSGDPDRLVQIFTNLADNALAHTPRGGRVQLQLRAPEAAVVEVVVQDTGAGIAADDLPRIFERFYRADKSRQLQRRQGAGLGLAIVQELVHLHDGRIHARSEPGKGSAFVVRLPAGGHAPGLTGNYGQKH